MDKQPPGRCCHRNPARSGEPAQLASKRLFPATVAAGTREEPWRAVRGLSRQPLDKCVLRTYCVPALVPGAEKNSSEQDRQVPWSPQAFFLKEGHTLIVLNTGAPPLSAGGVHSKTPMDA